ncbi:hypothetical protein ECG_09066 [Echinococcus granulosus]|nr:hypothetical protein ECG_09066 [Echinococcus granulosus]
MSLEDITYQSLDPVVYSCLEFFVELPQAYIQELPFEVLDAVGRRLRIEESEREPLKSYLEYTDSQAFVDQDKYDFERTRALAVHSLRLHPQDVNEIIKHEIEVLEKKKLEKQERSKVREVGATDVERVIDRWLSFRASANQASTTSSPVRFFTFLEAFTNGIPENKYNFEDSCSAQISSIRDNHPEIL